MVPPEMFLPPEGWEKAQIALSSQHKIPLWPEAIEKKKKSLCGYHPRILEIRHRNPGHVPKGKSGDRKDYFKGLIG